MTNKTAQFTPGPWYVHSNKIAVGDKDNDRHIIADIRGMEAFGNPTPNANLIAAAPTMYEALKRIKVLMESGDIEGRDWVEYGHIINALAQAEGSNHA
jgi:hypothetical protein